MRNRTSIVTGALALLALCATPLAAHETAAGVMRIDHAWARATAGMAKVGAAYVTVINEGAEMDHLVGAATPVAAKAELHTVVMENGVMSMRPVHGVEVHPGEPVVLRPGGIHVMLMGLKHPLKEGETFPLTLTFEHGGPVEVDVIVQKAGSMGPESHGHETEQHDQPMHTN